LRAIATAKAETAVGNLKQTGSTGLNDAQASPFANAHLREATNPGRIARDFGDDTDIARSHHI
jgi:hypothetical protein